MPSKHQTHPIDPTSAERLAEGGLRLGLVDTRDAATFEAWVQADNRGFHAPRTPSEQTRQTMDAVAYRRTTAVWDDTADDAASPVGTVNSFPTPLTLPGGRSVPAWGISAVTVAPTHRRRGIARALLEAELRTAKELGLPIAALTVSEATIYERFGFAPAAFAADLEIDTRRARWTGPTVPGRLHLVPIEQLREQLPAIIEQTRLQSAGEIQTWPHLWDRMLGLIGEKGAADKLRAVRYDDEDGTARGFAVYKMTEHESDYSRHTATVVHLAAVTDDAYAALWRYVLELDLTSTVVAPLRSVDEPLIWQVVDQRAVKARHHDHLWLRILDVAEALSARSLEGDVTIEVTDELGLTDGTFTLQGKPAATADVTLSVNALGALYLGGVSAGTLERAGRLTAHTEGAAAALDRAFAAPAAPWLSVWF